MHQVPKTYNGVKISDELLGNPKIPKKTKVHDDVLITEEQGEALEVLPKDTFYSSITKKDGELQAEVCFGKMRWCEINADNPDVKNEVYDPTTLTIDLSNKKATEMRANQRVKLVEPDVDDEIEVK